MPIRKGYLILIFASAILAGCQNVTPSANCAPFVRANLSPAGAVALISADRPAYERVSGNDRAGIRKGCW